jgi:choline dehydrogenase
MSRIVIVGAGSAGMTLAWALSQDPATDLVLVEAGADPGPAVPDSLRRETPLPAEYYWPYADAGTGEFLPRGKVLGGSSAANFSCAVRGQSASYDAWGIDDWTWERCLPAFRAIEADQDYGAEPYHGADGPVPVVRRPLGDRDEALLAAYDKLGYALVPDHNAPEGTGYGPIPRNRAGPDRASTLLTMLPDLRTRDNVTIRANREVTRVLFTGRRARAVEAAAAGGTEVIEADTVVLSAGTYGTPEILFNSGIGPADALRATGLPVLSAAPEVGQRLRDNPLLLLNVESSLQPEGDPVLLTVALDGGPNRLAHLFPFKGLVPGLPPTAVSFLCGLMSPASQGFLELGGTRARVRPRRLATADDQAQAAQILARADDILRQLAGTGHVTIPDDPWWRRGAAAAGRQDITWYNHPVGTCRMGTDDNSVVDEHLRVRGIDSLMVADASVMPDIPRSQTNLPSMMIGYRAAGFLSERLQAAIAPDPPSK